MIATAQLPLIVAPLAILFIFEEAHRVWAYAAAGALLALDVVK